MTHVNNFLTADVEILRQLKFFVSMLRDRGSVLKVTPGDDGALVISLDNCGSRVSYQDLDRVADLALGHSSVYHVGKTAPSKLKAFVWLATIEKSWVEKSRAFLFARKGDVVVSLYADELESVMDTASGTLWHRVETDPELANFDELKTALESRRE